MALKLGLRPNPAPNFSGSGSMLGNAITAFRNAISGGDIITEQANTAMDRQDEYLTNEAINNAYRTGSFDPRANRRVDSGAVVDALKAREDIETADALQAESAQELIKLERENSPEWLEAERLRKEREDNLKEQELQARIQEIEARRAALDHQKRMWEQEENLDATIDSIDNEFAGRRQQYVVESQKELPSLVNQWIAERNFDSNNPDHMAALQQATRRFRRELELKGQELFDQDFDSVMNEFEGRYSSKALALSTPGKRRDSLIKSLENFDATAQREAAKELTERRTNLEEARQGSLFALEKDSAGNWGPRKGKATDGRLNAGDVATELTTNFGGYSPSKTDIERAKEVLTLVKGNKDAWLDAVQQGHVARKEGMIWDTDAEIDWNKAKLAASQIGTDLEKAAKDFRFEDGSGGKVFDGVPLKSTESGNKSGENKSEGENVETDLSKRINDILGRDEKLDIHPSRSETDPAVQRLKRVVVELETLHKNGDGLPLSTQQLEDRREAMLEIIREVQKKSSRKNIGITDLQNPVQPKI